MMSKNQIVILTVKTLETSILKNTNKIGNLKFQIILMIKTFCSLQQENIKG